MEDERRMTGIFFTGIAASSFIISPDVMDLTLVARFITLSLFLFLGFAILAQQAAVLRVKADLPLTAYGLYTAFCCCSVLWAHTTSEALFESAKVFLGFCVFLLTIFTLRRDEGPWLNRLLALSVVLFFMELVIIAIQLRDLGNLEKESLYSISGMNGHKNLLTSFLLLNLFFLIKALYRLKKAWKVMAAVAIVLNLVLTGFLQTKAVWLGLLIALLTYAAAYLFIAIRKRIKLKLKLYAGIGLVMLLINLFFLTVLPAAIDRGLAYNQGVKTEGINTASRELDDERLTLWQKTNAVFREKPLAGTGMGNWQIWYPKAGLDHLWRAEELNYTFQRPHNDWLWILSETGLIGFNLFLLFAVSILAFLLKAAVAAADDVPRRKRLLGYMAVISAYFTVAFFDFPRERMEHTIWINLIFGMAYVEVCHSLRMASLPAFTVRRPHLLIPAAVLLFITVTGILRHQGEYSLRNMYIAKNRGDRRQVIAFSQEAESVAYTIDPTSMPLCWYSGNAKAQEQDFAGAHLDLLRAYSLNPYNRNVLNDLASSYALRNETETARYYYREAARISPRFDEPKLNLAAMYIREENYRMALYWLSRLVHPSERGSRYEAIVMANLKQAFPDHRSGRSF